MPQISLYVLPGGQIRTVYNESLDLNRLGAQYIRRASHVEPDSNGQWRADLSPVGGPILGPFRKRSDALEAERDWLEKYLLHLASPFYFINRLRRKHPHAVFT